MNFQDKISDHKSKLLEKRVTSGWSWGMVTKYILVGRPDAHLFYKVRQPEVGIVLVLLINEAEKGKKKIGFLYTDLRLV